MLRLPVASLACFLPVFATMSGCALSAVRGTFQPSYALAPTTEGKLETHAARIAAQLDPGETAFWLLDAADYAYEARLALVDRATESLDIQYFIWEKDPTSRLFTGRIMQAAERGVRVRILLDDLTLNGQDAEYFGLDAHPNVEVRTFNPWNRRSNLLRAAEFLVRFGRLNNRMHNKIMVADGHFGMVGGRNIGDRYFGLWDDFVQNDLDAMLVGPVVRELADGFDLYWNSSEAFPLEAVVSSASGQQTYEETRKFVEEFYRSQSDRLRKFPLEREDWNGFFEKHDKSFLRGRPTYVFDNPEISVGDPVQLVRPLNEFLAQARERVIISSPYLVPDDGFVEVLAQLEQRGVEVIILTNSLATNNHLIAHAAYERVRRRLIRLGVDVYEARFDSPVIDFYTAPPGTPRYLGLHTKGAVVDGRFSYLGSANIDPRSLEFNTELALFIDSPEVAAALTALIARDMHPDAAWHVTLDGKRKLRWTSSAGSQRRQPDRGFGQRLAEFFVGMLPFKQQS